MVKSYDFDMIKNLIKYDQKFDMIKTFGQDLSA